MNRWSCARALLLALICGPVPAAAVTTVGFDHALPLEPQALEGGGAIAGGDDTFTVYGITRIGVLQDLDATLMAGFVHFAPDGTDGENGFELAASARMRFMRAVDTRAVDLAVAGKVSILNVSGIFQLGIDPQVIASRHFDIASDRKLWVALGLGMGISYIDFEGPPSDTDIEAGLLGNCTAGVDIVKDLSFSLSLQLRDDLERAAIAVTHRF